MSLIKPKALQPGDLVQVVASSSPFEKQSLLNGVEILENFGFRVKYEKSIFNKHSQHPYLAGTDERRVRELEKALLDDKVKAIFFARGGYGAVRLIPHLLKKRIKPKAKIISGLSDATTLHLYFQKILKWTMFYGPVIGGQMKQLEHKFTHASFGEAMMSAKPWGERRFADMIVINKGKARAPLVGGCLTLVCNSLATPFEIETKGKILFIEDVHEKPYQIDRLLMHLKMAGKFKGCAGVVLGYLTGPNPVGHYIRTVKDIFADEDFPVLMNFPSGHMPKTFTLPLGVKVEIQTSRKSITFLESALSA